MFHCSAFNIKLLVRNSDCFVRINRKIASYLAVLYITIHQISKLHKMYLENQNKIVNIRINDNIIEKKFKIDKKRVIDYVNDLEPERLMFCINYNKRLN